MPAGMLSACRARPLLLGVALALAAPLAQAADMIEPDRPDVTDSTTTVGRGVFQIETGVEYSRTSEGGGPPEYWLSVPIVLRVGLIDRLEVQLGGEALVRLRNSEEDTGNGDLTIALKYRFLHANEGDWWPALGVLPYVKVPTARAPIGTERPDFGATLLVGFNLPWDLALDANAGLAAIGQTHSGGFLLQGLVSASLQRTLLAERLVVFGELFFFSRGERDGRDRFGGDSGLIYRLTPNLAVDAAVETTLAGGGPDYTIRAGLSTRFGRVTR
jgi:hypothetical protein